MSFAATHLYQQISIIVLLSIIHTKYLNPLPMNIKRETSHALHLMNPNTMAITSPTTGRNVSMARNTPLCLIQ